MLLAATLNRSAKETLEVTETVLGHDSGAAKPTG